MLELLDKDDEDFEKDMILKELKKKLPRMIRWYMWFTKHSNPVALTQDFEYIHNIKKEMQNGKRVIRNEFEKIMIYDINLKYKLHLLEKK